MKTNIKLAKVDMEERKGLEFASGDTVRVWNKLNGWYSALK